MRPSSSKSTVGGKLGGPSSVGGGETEGVNEGPATTEKDPVRGLDNFPGGDAMLEVLTRLQRLQEAFSSQLQVRPHPFTKLK